MERLLQLNTWLCSRAGRWDSDLIFLSSLTVAPHNLWLIFFCTQVWMWAVKLLPEALWKKEKRKRKALCWKLKIRTYEGCAKNRYSPETKKRGCCSEDNGSALGRVISQFYLSCILTIFLWYLVILLCENEMG